MLAPRRENPSIHYVNICTRFEDFYEKVVSSWSWIRLYDLEVTLAVLSIYLFVLVNEELMLDKVKLSCKGNN